MAIDARLLLMGRTASAANADRARNQNQLSQLAIQNAQRNQQVRNMTFSPEEEAMFARTNAEMGQDAARLNMQTARMGLAEDQLGQLYQGLGAVSQMTDPAQITATLDSYRPMLEGNDRALFALDRGLQQVAAGDIAGFQAGVQQTLDGLRAARVSQTGRPIRNDRFGVPRFEDTGEVAFPNAQDPGLTEYQRQSIEEQRAARMLRANTLPPESRQFVFNAIDEENKAGQAASKALDLARRFEEFDPLEGAGGSAYDRLKSIFGNEDEVNLLRTEYNGMRNSSAIANLPPGVASDKDIQLALAGFPSATASNENVASFLRGMAKMSAMKQAYHREQSRWFDDPRNGVDGTGFGEYWQGIREGVQSAAWKSYKRQMFTPSPTLQFDNETGEWYELNQQTGKWIKKQ